MGYAMNRFFFIWLISPALAACAAFLPGPDCQDNSLRNQMLMTFEQKRTCKWT